jgi:hypothetical protein
MAWIICNTEEPELCWSNEEGWTPDNYDTFSNEERETLSLPLGGDWERVPWSKMED